MKLSNTELEYLRVSLTGSPIVRPDSRQPGQFRPVDAEIDILPTANGSSRVRAADGSECIVGIKTEVVPSHSNLVDVSVEIAGLKNNDQLPNSLGVVLKQVLSACPEVTQRSLILNPTYAFKLFVDCVVLSYTSHPLSLLSIAIFQALKSAKLPQQLGVTGEDSELVKKGDEVEIPQFSDDWSSALPLCPPGWTPPLLFIVALVGHKVIIDPTISEEAVSEASLFVTWKNSRVAAPIRTLDSTSGTFLGAFDPELVFEAYSLVEECAPQVEASLLEH